MLAVQPRGLDGADEELDRGKGQRRGIKDSRRRQIRYTEKAKPRREVKLTCDPLVSRPELAYHTTNHNISKQVVTLMKPLAIRPHHRQNTRTADNASTDPQKTRQ